MRIKIAGLSAILSLCLFFIGLFTEEALTAPNQCSAQIKQERERLYKEGRQIDANEPKRGLGPSVTVGPCATRLAKLDGNELCCKTNENLAPFWEQKSCVKLQMFYLNKLCACESQGYSKDEGIQDDTLKAYATAIKLRDKARSAGIKNLIIREFVKKIDKQKDCITTESVRFINTAMEELEGSLSKQ